MRNATLQTLLPLTLLALSSGGCRQSQAATAVAPPAGEVWITPQQSDEAHLTTAAAVEREVGNVIVTSGKVDARVSVSR